MTDTLRGRSVSARQGSWPAPRAPRLDRVAELLPYAVGALVFAGLFLRYRSLCFLPQYAGVPGYLLSRYDGILAGTIDAPTQYRPFMPWVTRWFVDASGLSFPHAVLMLDAGWLAVAMVALGRWTWRREVPWAFPVAAGGLAFFQLNTDNWSPELWLCVAAVAVTALCLDRSRVPAVPVLVVGAVLLGSRADYAATLAVALLLLGLVRRRAVEAALGLVLMAGAAWATWWWPRVFPQAHYETSLVQLDFNIRIHSWWIVATYYGALLLVPLVLLASRRVPPCWPLLVWFAAEFAVTFVVGRVEETRIFTPYAPALAVAAVLASLQMRPAREPRDEAVLPGR